MRSRRYSQALPTRYSRRPKPSPPEWRLDVAMNIIQVLDDEEDTDAEEPLPGWRLMELGTTGEPTGRDLAALHESFFDADPRHVDGEDIRGW